jgi:hypothetical protein
MHSHEHDVDPVLITTAAPSFDDEQRARRHRYALLMTVHIIGFAAAGALYYVAWWLGLVVMVATGALPWIAVVAANDATPRSGRASPLSRNDSSARELDSHITIEPKS